MDSFPIHCNYCYRRRSLEPNLEFYVSHCGHIVCRSCLNDKCPKCFKVFSSIAINNEMPAGMLDYLEDPIKLLRHFQKVTKFQYNQERNLVEHMITSNAQAEKSAEDTQRRYLKVQQSLQRKLDKERERLQKCREYIAYHERRFEQSRYMTPPKPAPPRLRYPARKGTSVSTMVSSSEAEINFMPKLTQAVQAKYSAPRSPTLSTNSSNITGDDSMSEILREMSASISLSPSTKQKKNKKSFSFPK